VKAGELAIFEPSHDAIDFHAETDTEFVLGSAAPYAHDLVLPAANPSARSLPPHHIGAGGLAMINELGLLDVRVSHGMLATGTWLRERDAAGHVAANRPLRTVVVVSGFAPQTQSPDESVDTSEYDVMFVASVAHSYSCIKLVVPDLVVISSEVDDMAACQLLSMLRLDRRFSDIPVLARTTLRGQHDADDDLAELDQDTSPQSLATHMN
jgi:hypothetical protein